MEDAIRRRIAAEPGCRRSLYRLLDFCQLPRSLTAIEQVAENTNMLHSCNDMLTWLEEDGAMVRIGDADHPRWQTTAVGRNVARDYDPEAELAELLFREEGLRPMYRELLHFCRTPKSRTEIECMLAGNPLTVDLRIFPICLVQRLEQAGAMRWQSAAWVTTESGHAGLARLYPQEESRRG